ncbi:hypothetical protein [Hyphomonas sp.]|uniref:hypothetical protein n=1 Tax=Hyphomonas sp. TaxID=87 RepID=UPI0025C4D1F8|nr:hypothetical protein [Hyphomonas sp.]
MKREKSKRGALSSGGMFVTKATWIVAKGTGKAAFVVGKPIAKGAGTIVSKGASASANYAKRKLDEQALLMAPTSAENWYAKAALSCERTVDALLNQANGTAARVVSGLAGKLGGAGATAGIFSIASIFGTASTGTAISTLSGAAFNSAALAWIGGSVASGALVVSGVGLLGGLLVYFGARRWLSRVNGKTRKKEQLDDQEDRVVETLLLLATSFRKQAEINSRLQPLAAVALRVDALEPLVNELGECRRKVADWPDQPKKKLEKQVERLKNLLIFLTDTGGSERNGMMGKPMRTGIVSATLLKLQAERTLKFSEDEELVLDALRRSNSRLNDASTEELARYVQSMSPEQIPGLTNNVKGIYHELTYERAENSDGDEYVVELFEVTNHPGADIRITNTDTGEITTAQLKATNYSTYLREHNQRYESVDLFVTSEVAASDAEFTSSGFSNLELTEDTAETLEKLELAGRADIIESMGVAAMVNVSRNAGAYLAGRSVSEAGKKKMIEDGIVAASVAGLTRLIL